MVLLSRIFWSLVGLLFSNEFLGFFVVLGLLLLFSGLLLGLLLGLFLLFLGLLSVLGLLLSFRITFCHGTTCDHRTQNTNPFSLGLK